MMVRRDVKLPTNTDRQGYPVCPDCGCQDSELINTYKLSDGRKRRRRICDNCRNPFYTIQQPEEVQE